MKTRSVVLGMAVVAAWIGAPAIGDELAQPWGTMHGNIGGTSASDDPSMIFQAEWANGAEPAWTMDTIAEGFSRPAYWSSIVFDEEGNLYWKSQESAVGAGDAQIISVAPDGTLRWVANDGAGSDHFLGTSSTDSPVVGDGGASGRIYALGDDANGGFVVAYNKSDGAVAGWVTQLPGSNFSNSDVGVRRLTPILYNGKLYVVGAYLFNPVTKPPVKVYQIDTATGILDWSADIPASVVGGIYANYRGQMTMVPDAFGAGKHGLYFNGSSGSGTDTKPEMYCIMVDTAGNTASLAWSSEGGHVTRSHVIHMVGTDGVPSTVDDRVCTATWTDFGAEMYCWNLDGSNLQTANNAANTGHGFYDIGCVEFDGRSIIAGGFEGQIVRYMDIDVNTNSEPGGTDVYYQLPNNWWGEPRAIGGLYQDVSGNSIFVSGTNSRSDCASYPPGSLGECLGATGYEARVFAVDLTNGNYLPNCEAIDDGPIYIDNFKITGGADELNQSTILDVAGFESYAVGDVPTNGTNPGGTQPGGFTWETSPWVSSNGSPQIVSIAPAMSTNGVGTKALKLDAFQGCYNDYQGVFANLGSPTTDNVVIVSWDQYRDDVWDNVYMTDHPDGDAWWALQWDILEQISARQTDAFSQQKVLAKDWQHVEYKFDFQFYEVAVTIDDVTTSAFLDPFGDPGSGTLPETNLRGMTIAIEGGEYSQAPAALTPPVFEYNTGSIQDHAFTVRGGPLLGPTTGGANNEQHIYYFRPANANFNISEQLVALRPLAEAKDCNNNGVADSIDIAQGTSSDCNANNVPDECDIAAGTSADSYGDGCVAGANGVPDECEDLTGPMVVDARSWKQHGMASGDFLRIEMDQQINLSSNGADPDFDAIYSLGGGYIMFSTTGVDDYTRMFADGNTWYYGPEVDFALAGAEPISIAGGGSLQFDARYFQGGDNTAPYDDAPIFVRLYTDDASGNYQGYRDLGIVYQTNSAYWLCTPVAAYPNWQHITLDLGNLLADNNCDGTPDVADVGNFDPTRVTRLRFYGTDWAGKGQDYIDIKNVEFNTDPYPNVQGLDMVTTNGGTVEPRQDGPTEVVVTFQEDAHGVGGISIDDVTVSSGTVTNVSTNGKALTIEMNGATNDQLLTVGFPGIRDEGGCVSTDQLTFGVLEGDSDGDMNVDLHDWFMFQACYGTGGGALRANCARTDYITDGEVDLTDHSTFVGAMTGP